MELVEQVTMVLAVFALLGALLMSMIVAPVLATFLFRPGAREWHNPLMTWLPRQAA